MPRTRDQRDLEAILALCEEARNAAYSLFSRRLDTRRNVESFIGLRDAFILLKKACATLETAIEQATEPKSSDQNSVSEEIMIRAGRMTIIKDEEPRQPAGPAKIFDFPKKD